MPDWNIELHPLTRLQIFREVKKLVFQQMDKNIMNPERGREIVEYIGKEIMTIRTPRAAQKFFEQIIVRFPELKSIEKKFRFQSREKMDNVVSALIDLMISRGDFDLVEAVIQEVKKIEKNGGDIFEFLSQKYPADFEAALKQVR